MILPAFLRRELRWHLESYAEAGPDGLLFVGEKGAPFRRSTFGRKWRRAREVVGERQEEVAAGLDATVRKARAATTEKAPAKRSGTDLARGN